MKNYRHSNGISKSKYLSQIKAMVDKHAHITSNGEYHNSFKELVVKAKEEGYSASLVSEIAEISVVSVYNWARHKPESQTYSVRELEIVDEIPESKIKNNEKFRFSLKFCNLFEFEIISKNKIFDIKFSKIIGDSNVG
jgi:hypothetical protein